MALFAVGGYTTGVLTLHLGWSPWIAIWMAPIAATIAALIIGSALIVISDTPPLFYGISLIGIIGFFAAAIMGIWLLVAILRKGGL